MARLVRLVVPGHPPGSATFVESLEQAAGRVLRLRKTGRPAKLLKQPN